MLRKTPIALASVVLWGFGPSGATAQTTPSTSPPPPASAASGAAAEPATPLAPLTNTATRTERRADDVPATVTVVPAREIEARGARDLKDLFRNDVDLSVRQAPARFGAAGASTGRAGAEGLNIRGLEGNQVLMLVDGIRVPAAFSFGAFATGRADYLALEATQAVDVLRGPASTQFGSDGLAGALSLRTLDPADLLNGGRDSGGFMRLGGSSVDDAVVLTAAAAARAGDWQALLLASRREGHETQNQGRDDSPDSRRTAPNPLDTRQQVLLGKLQLQASPTHRLGATLEAVQRRTTTAVLSGRTAPPDPAAPPPPFPVATVVDLDARDRVQRQRLSLEHQFDDLNAAFVQKAQTRLYRQDAEVRQFADEQREGADDRTRDNRYRERVSGASVQFESNLVGAGAGAGASAVAQRLSYGVDWSRTEITSLRDGTPNPSAPPPFGETFPVKPFPDTRYTLAGAFVQSEVEAGALTLIPALRYDRYALTPSAAGYTGGAAVALSGDALNPRIGLVWRASPTLAPYAQWSRGFRAPTPGQVNNGFTNVAAGYQSIGNPDLQPETAQSIEVGLRGTFGGTSAGPNGVVRWQVAAYDNRYRDFISQEVVRGTGTPTDPLIFQFINLAQARIRGAELRADWQLDAHWSLNAATAATRGTRTTAGVGGELSEPLDSVDPARTALGLRWTGGAWELRADVLHAQAKARERIRSVTPTAYAAPGYTVLDLSARWQPRPDWTLTAQLNNVTDATYWRWSDVRGLADASPVLDAYTAPGRHLQLALRHDF